MTDPVTPVQEESRPNAIDAMVEVYQRLLISSGRECEHPEEMRRPIPDYRSGDQNEWECRACGIWQVKEPSR